MSTDVVGIVGAKGGSDRNRDINVSEVDLI